MCFEYQPLPCFSFICHSEGLICWQLPYGAWHSVLLNPAKCILLCCIFDITFGSSLYSSVFVTYPGHIKCHLEHSCIWHRRSCFFRNLVMFHGIETWTKIPLLQIIGFWILYIVGSLMHFLICYMQISAFLIDKYFSELCVHKHRYLMFTVFMFGHFLLSWEGWGGCFIVEDL